MNKVVRDELITEIRALLLRKYPDYIFKELFQDDAIDSIRIKIFFWDMENQRDLLVGLVITTMELLTAPSFLIEVLITRIDAELTKLKEEKYDL